MSFRAIAVSGCKLVCAIVVLAGVAAGARAQDLTTILGPLASRVSVGTSGNWAVLPERDRVVMTNTTETGAVRYYSVPFQGDAAKGRSVRVRVSVVGRGSAAGGLIYNVRDTAPKWIALVITSDGNLVVYARQADAVTEISRAPVPGGTHPDGELLQISETAGKTTFFVNGQSIGDVTLAEAGQKLPDNPAGLIAISPGRIAFRDFGFGPAVTTTGNGDDRIGGNSPTSTGNDDHIGPASTGKPPGRWPVPQLDPLAANVLGASMGILAHEFGHFMIGELKIPAIGPEEDVADEFAAMVFVDNMRDMPEAASTIALSLAKFWWYSAEDGGDKGQPPWFDEHAPDRARFGRFMCMLYGAAPRVFEPVMQQTGIPERTRARCIDDERKRHAAWDTLLRSHRRRGVDPVMPGDLDPSTPGKTVTVEYAPTSNENYAALGEFLKRSQMLETAADLLSKLYVLPRDTKIIVRECGAVNCFYNSRDGSVTICYEMLAYVLVMFNRHEGTQGQPVTTGTTAPTPQPAPQTAPPASTLDIAGTLAGIWRMQINSGSTVDNLLIEAKADGTYKARHEVGVGEGKQVVVATIGRWSAEPVAERQSFKLVITPLKWYPTNICNDAGACTPLNLSPVEVVVRVQDRNTLVAQDIRATRVQ